MYERVYYRPRYDRPPHAASFLRVIIGVSGISGEFSGCLITKALESFGAGSSSVEGDLELSVPVCSALTSPFSELEMRTALCLFLKLTRPSLDRTPGTGKVFIREVWARDNLFKLLQRSRTAFETRRSKRLTDMPLVQAETLSRPVWPVWRSHHALCILNSAIAGIDQRASAP
jgi:hypothetical protein